ncbi:MAG: hypothetical protein ACXVBW_10875, partial [Bdellovibrionota bacterium]
MSRYLILSAFLIFTTGCWTSERCKDSHDMRMALNQIRAELQKSVNHQQSYQTALERIQAQTGLLGGYSSKVSAEVDSQLRHAVTRCVQTGFEPRRHCAHYSELENKSAAKVALNAIDDLIEGTAEARPGGGQHYHSSSSSHSGGSRSSSTRSSTRSTSYRSSSSGYRSTGFSSPSYTSTPSHHVSTCDQWVDDAPVQVCLQSVIDHWDPLPGYSEGKDLGYAFVELKMKLSDLRDDVRKGAMSDSYDSRARAALQLIDDRLI